MICGSPRIQTLWGEKKWARKSWTWTDFESSCTTPSASEPKNARGRLCIRAMTTAANDPRMRNVNCWIANPFCVPSSTPDAPASAVPIIHDPAETYAVLTPTVRAIAGESTVARTESPKGVARSSNVNSTASTTAATITATSFESMPTPNTLYWWGGLNSTLGNSKRSSRP